MKQILSFAVLTGLILPTSLLPYYAEKKGLKVLVVDCARAPEALCVEAPMDEAVQNYVGKGISAQTFMNGGLRPVGVTITNTTDKPMMFAPSYDIKATNSSGMIDALTFSMYPYGLIASSVTSYLSGCGAFISWIAFLAANRWDKPIALGFGATFLAAFVGSTALAIHGGYLLSQFKQAMKMKFEELNFKEEALILPGETIQKLLLCQKEAYISRFPLVIYPLEKREDMIVFDVDLRA